MQDGLQLALWPWASIAADTGLPAGGGKPGAFTIGHNVNSKTEVDQAMDQAAKAGAAIVKPPQQTFYGGYAGYFRDIDGHLWEVVWDPSLFVEE